MDYHIKTFKPISVLRTLFTYLL